MQIRFIRDYLAGSFMKTLNPDTIYRHDSTLNVIDNTNVKNWVQVKAITNENIGLFAVGTNYNYNSPAEIWINNTQININWSVMRGHALVIFGSDNKTPVFNQSYDTYSTADQINSLAAKINRLSIDYPTNYWAIVSYDAIGMNPILSQALSNIGTPEFNPSTGRFAFAAVGYGGECLASECDRTYVSNGSNVLRAEIFINGKNAAKNVSATTSGGSSIPRITNGKANMSSSSDCYTNLDAATTYVQVDLGSLIDIEYIHMWFGYLPVKYNYYFNSSATEKWIYRKHRLDVSTDGATWMTIQNNENPLIGLSCGRKYYLQNPTIKNKKITNTPILQILSTINENLLATNDTPKVSLKDVYSPHSKNMSEHLNKIIKSVSMKATGVTTTFIDNNGSSNHGKYENTDINKLNDVAIKFSNQFYTCNDNCVATCTSTCSSICTDTCGSTTCGYTCSYMCGKDCWDSCGTTYCSGSCGASSCKSSCGASTCSHTCGTTCSATCGSGCTSSCGSNCSGTCGSDCTKGCSGGQGGCAATCQGGWATTCPCSGNCTGNCTNGCGGGCYAVCSVSCTNVCSGGCRSLCGGNCSGVCYGACAGNCAGTWCTAICHSGCAGQCASSICKSGCGGGCGSLCYLMCGSNCGINCSETCSVDCSNGCTSHCSHETNA